MAVFTVLDQHDVAAFIEPYGIGPLVGFQGIAAGTENTNYLVTTQPAELSGQGSATTTRSYVLTVFEQIPTATLLFVTQLTALLNRNSLPVPTPLADRQGQTLKQIYNKSAVLTPKVEGVHPLQPNKEQCTAIGIILGQIHICTSAAKLQHPIDRGIEWMATAAEQLSSSIEQDQRPLLAEVKRFRQLAAGRDLPQGVIHSDLFRDNTLCVGDTITGIIDFNNAGNSFLGFDLAVVVNDWCSRPDGSLNAELASAVLTAYNSQRTLTNDERGLWNDLLRIAAARFWLSRLLVQRETAVHAGELVDFKDPAEYLRVLRHRISNPAAAG